MAIQGVLKTAAVVALFFPLVILAVPFLDTAFVVAKRIKYRQPVHQADSEHFHHRFSRIGFSQTRTVLYLYAWTVSLAALALALRFVPYSDDDGTLNAGWAIVMGGFFLVALAASVYLVVVLEILKFRRFRERELRRARSQTGEMPALTPDADRGGDRARGGDRRVRGGQAGAVARGANVPEHRLAAWDVRRERPDQKRLACAGSGALACAATGRRRVGPAQRAPPRPARRRGPGR